MNLRNFGFKINNIFLYILKFMNLRNFGFKLNNIFLYIY